MLNNWAFNFFAQISRHLRGHEFRREALIQGEKDFFLICDRNKKMEI